MNILRRSFLVLASPQKPVKRHLWGWLNTIFNRVDPQRIQDVGPDRACAEWLIRCGASVKWKGTETWFNDYNSLPGSNIRVHKIEAIDASSSAIMNIGFPHLRGLQHLRKIILHRCPYVEDNCLSSLSLFAGPTLTHLQVSSCGNITTEGLMFLPKLQSLQYLMLYDLPEIEEKEKVEQALRVKMPNCELHFPYAQATELVVEPKGLRGSGPCASMEKK